MAQSRAELKPRRSGFFAAVVRRCFAECHGILRGAHGVKSANKIVGVSSFPVGGWPSRPSRVGRAGIPSSVPAAGHCVRVRWRRGGRLVLEKKFRMIDQRPEQVFDRGAAVGRLGQSLTEVVTFVFGRIAAKRRQIQFFNDSRIVGAGGQ